MNRLLFIFLLISSFTIISDESHAKTLRIKLATLAPEGTSWVNSLREMSKEMYDKTNGKVKLKIYPGGVMGDENVVLQKIRAGQLHAAALTGIGLGQIEKAERILEMPFLFSNYDEIDYVTAKITPKIESMFKKKGYIILGWTETGLVNFYSKKPITSLETLQKAKMWSWSSDPLAKVMFDAFKINAVPLELTDVPMSLDTGIINACYATPMAALALQWAPRINYITKQNLAYSTGAIVITQKIFNKIPSEYRKTIMEITRKYSKQITKATRDENAKALKEFEKDGKKFVEFDLVQAKEVIIKSRSIRKSLVGKFFSKSLHNEVVRLRNSFRKSDLKNLTRKAASLDKSSKDYEAINKQLEERKLFYADSKEDLI